jgi:hypothetical protein
MKFNHDEWHAFWIGWGHGVSPKFCTMFPMPMDYINPLQNEYHYYTVGRAIGFLTVLGVVIGGILWLL